ncbi:MAG: TRAP transporter substrate-binding protein DctP [Alphaproteobacteria bacterium]
MGRGIAASFCKTVLTAGTVVAGLVAAATRPSYAQASADMAWDMALYGVPRSVMKVADEVSRQVEVVTQGKFKIRTHYGAGLAPEKEILDGLSIGAFQIGWVVVGYAPGKLLGVTGLDLPFLPVSNLEALQKVRYDYLAQPEVANDFTRWGTVVLLPAPLPFFEFMGKGKGLASVADFSGKRLRVLGGLGDGLRLIGAAPTSFTSPELYPALERGVLDGLAIPYSVLAAYKIHEISTWYTKGLTITPPIAVLAMNLKAYESLAPQYRKALHDVGPSSIEAQMKAVEADEIKAEEMFLQRGIQKIVFPPAEFQKLAERAGRPIWDKWVQDVTSKGYPGQRLLDVILTSAKKANS